MKTNIINAWITCPRLREKAQLRLFCLPYAGGNASIYHAWADHLPEEIEVCPIQLPGRGSRFSETPLSSLSLLLPALAEAMPLDLPFALFGHSMGALTSFELARYLRRHRYPQPALLILSGHHAPQLPKSIQHISTLPDKQFMDALRDYNGTPTELLQNNELMELVAPVLRADFSVCESYVYTHEDSLNCPIFAYGGLHDSDANLPELLAWRDQTSKNLVVKIFPGDHFFIDTTRDLLLRSLREDLELILSSRPA